MLACINLCRIHIDIIIIIFVTLKRAMEKICNCKPTYMQPIDKTLNFHEKSSFWHVNYGRFWLDDSSETPWRSLKPTMLKDLFTDPS